MIFVKKITVSNFRMIQNVLLEPSRRLNIITGKNGTAKSTLLGMVAQGFSFNNKVINYESLKNSKVKELNKEEYEKLDPNDELALTYRSLLTLFGDKFESISSDHFKLSEMDARGLKHCEVELSNGDKYFVESTKHNDRSKPRFVTRRGDSSSNYVHPVIYLGLDRLYTLVKARDIKKLVPELRDEDKKEIHSLYESILLKKYDDNFSAAETDLRSKKTASFFPEDRTIEMISSGEDNVGQILLALYSFKKLKNLFEEYSGGILIIDEVDATLYPAAQNKLIDVLLNKSIEFDIQVFMTSHSLTLLEYLEAKRHQDNRFRNQIKIFSNTLTKEILSTAEVDYIYPLKNELLAQAQAEQITSTVKVYLEDKEAEFCFNHIVSSLKKDLKKRTKNISQVSMGCSTFKGLYDANVPEFKYNSIVCLDGDEDFSIKRMKNFVNLPFKALNPEEFVFNLLDNPQCGYWEKVNNYNHSIFMNNSHYLAVKAIKDGTYEKGYKNLSGSIYQGKPARVTWKMWFKEEQKNWKYKNNPIKFWVSENKSDKDLEAFLLRLEEAFNFVANNLKIERL